MRGLYSEFFVPKGVLPDSGGKLSGRTVVILQKMSRGESDDQILRAHPEFERMDIALAAREALILNGAAKTREERLAKIQQRYPRAYEKWSVEEEERIERLYKEGKTIREIAADCHRQPNAIKSRLERLGAR
jgi:hypothetical protein